MNAYQEATLTSEAIDALVERLNRGDAVRCDSAHLDALMEREIYPATARNRQRLGVYGEWVAWIPAPIRKRSDLNRVRLSRTGQPVDVTPGGNGDFVIASPTA